MLSNQCIRTPSWESQPKGSIDTGSEERGDGGFQQTSESGDPKSFSLRGRL